MQSEQMIKLQTVDTGVGQRERWRGGEELEEYMVKWSVHCVVVRAISKQILSMIDWGGKVSERREVREGQPALGRGGIWRRWRRRRSHSRAKTVTSKWVDDRQLPRHCQVRKSTQQMKITSKLSFSTGESPLENLQVWCTLHRCPCTVAEKLLILVDRWRVGGKTTERWRQESRMWSCGGQRPSHLTTERWLFFIQPW